MPMEGDSHAAHRRNETASCPWNDRLYDHDLLAFARMLCPIVVVYGSKPKEAGKRP
jgi:hypothetical protein